MEEKGLRITITEKIRDRAKGSKLARKILFPAIFFRDLILERREKVFDKFYLDAFQFVELGSLVVRVPDFEGSFEVDARSDTLKRLLKYKHYEPYLAEIAKKHINPERDVLDIGANIGLFSTLAAKNISSRNKVLSVEPTPLALKYLRGNIQRNNIQESVIIYEGAATDNPGNRLINIIPGKEEYSSLSNIVHPPALGKKFEALEVHSDTVDNLVSKFNLKPGFIKIDTEGGEYKVLKGALATITKLKPVIVSELIDNLLQSFGDSSAKVINLLEDNGYNVFNARQLDLPVQVPFDGEILALPAMER